MREFNCYPIILLLLFSCSSLVGQITQLDESISWLPERADVQAGAILVPENHEEPDGTKIQLTYIVLKAKKASTTSFPIVYLSGGPGAKTLSKDRVFSLLQSPLREQRDIILFDQRGIGYSSAMPDLSSGAFEILTKNANAAEELAMMAHLIDEYKERCKTKNIRPEFYNTMQSARDVGMLFEHLGYKKFNLMGTSYGTRLGRVIQDLFPNYVHSSVLDSPAPLSGDFLLDRIDSFSLALGRIFNYCSNDPHCTSQYPKLKEDYFKAIATLEEKPLVVMLNGSLEVFINAQDGIYLLRRLLYTNKSREKAPELIMAFLEGGKPILEEVLQYERELAGRLNYTMLLSVEKYENFNPDNTPQVIKDHYTQQTLLPTKLGFFDAFYQAGMNWHGGSLPREERKFNDSDIPTLIFVNQFDPVTPPENGRLFMEKLSHGTLLILDEGGHGGGNRACKNQVIIEFMNNPASRPGVACLNLFVN